MLGLAVEWTVIIGAFLRIAVAHLLFILFIMIARFTRASREEIVLNFIGGVLANVKDRRHHVIVMVGGRRKVRFLIYFLLLFFCLFFSIVINKGWQVIISFFVILKIVFVNLKIVFVNLKIVFVILKIVFVFVILKIVFINKGGWRLLFVFIDLLPRKLIWKTVVILRFLFFLIL